jgi:uncharacterized protein YukE
MDETFVEMQRFEQNLRVFNEKLQASLNELQEQHDQVSPHWQDEMRAEYDVIWLPFLETMNHYVASEGPAYVEFLKIKIHALRRYLRGG